MDLTTAEYRTAGLALNTILASQEWGAAEELLTGIQDHLAGGDAPFIGYEEALMLEDILRGARAFIKRSHRRQLGDAAFCTAALELADRIDGVITAGCGPRR